MNPKEDGFKRGWIQKIMDTKNTNPKEHESKRSRIHKCEDAKENGFKRSWIQRRRIQNCMKLNDHRFKSIRIAKSKCLEENESKRAWFQLFSSPIYCLRCSISCSQPSNLLFSCFVCVTNRAVETWRCTFKNIVIIHFYERLFLEKVWT